MKAINVKDVLVSARKNCLGMTEAIYQFADFLASRLNDTVTPEGLVMAIALAFSDITSDQHDSEYIKRNKRDVLNGAKYVLQIVDVMTDKEYSTAVRTTCEQVFPDWSPMVRLVPDKYRVYLPDEEMKTLIWIAVDWWVGAMQLHCTTMTLSDGRKIPTLRNNNLTQEQISEFAGHLFYAVLREMYDYGKAALGCEYPVFRGQSHLHEVCAQMGIDSECLFPAAGMTIHKDRIVIDINHQFETLWEAE